MAIGLLISDEEGNMLMTCDLQEQNIDEFDTHISQIHKFYMSKV